MIYFLVWLTSNLLTYKHCYVADLFGPLRQSTMKVQVNINVKVSAPRSSCHMGIHGKQAQFHYPVLYLSASCTVPPSTPDGSTPNGSATIFSETPPPIPFSTHPHYHPFLGNVVNPLHSHMHGETRVRHSGSEPPPFLFLHDLHIHRQTATQLLLTVKASIEIPVQSSNARLLLAHLQQMWDGTLQAQPALLTTVVQDTTSTMQ